MQSSEWGTVFYRRMEQSDWRMDIVSRHPSMTRRSSSSSEDTESVAEPAAALLASYEAPVKKPEERPVGKPHEEAWSTLPPELIMRIFSKLPLRDFVRLHLGCLKKWRPSLTSSRVFEGEPFFLRARLRDNAPDQSFDPTPGPPLACFYAFSMQKWIELLLPSSVQHLEPVSESGGLILFSGIPNMGPVMKLRQWWPLVVVNPITRENRSLLLMLEPPADLSDYACYSELHMGLRVNADSKTYKVVVHWMNYYVVQTFDSGSNQWSTLHVPKEEITYSNSSNEIVLCRNYERDQDNLDTWSVFDIGHGRLVDCTGDTISSMGYPTVGKSCLYIVSYDHWPLTFIRIHKRERRSTSWELVTKVPLERLCGYLEDADEEFPGEIHDTFATEGIVDIHECGNHLLFTATYDEIWCGMLYDLDKQLWIRHCILDENPGNRFAYHGLFFQPQLNGPPC